MIDKHLRAWFVVFVVAVFLAGMGAGLIVDRLLAPPRPGRAGADRPLPGPGRGMAAGPVMYRLADELELTAEQRPKFDAILQDSRARIQSVQGEVRGRFDAEQQRMREEIRNILTPQQRKRFDAWIAREPVPGLMRGPGGRPGPAGRGRMGRGRE